ncbi:MAG TPA: SNF2-related protein, partial [Pirellulaceae bacterium]|nr:SNF2-related protein [Pirellulaceae bacterium]
EYSHRWKQQLKVVRDSVTQTAETAIRTGLQNLAARHEVWFVVDCDASATIKSLVVAMFERFQSTTGAWSPLRPLSVSHHSLHQVTDPEDRALVEMLLGPDSHLLGDLFGGPGDSSTPLARWAPARRSAGSLTKSLYDIALPRLAATGRLVWAENARRDTDFTRQPALHWDSGQPWQYRVKVDTNRTHGVWKMGGELVRPDRVVSLAGTRLLFECGLAIVGDQLARMSLGEMHPWAMVLGNMNSIVIPFEDGPEFLSQLWSFPSGPGFELPKELQWTELDVEPQGRLTIRAVDMHGWRNRLLVSAEFLYDDVVVDRDATQTAAVHPSTKRVFRRRRDLEQKLLDQIDRLDWLEEEFNHFEGQSSHYVIESRRIEELVDLACAAGWVVVADGRVLRRGGAVRLSVSSGIDWFELKGTADFGGVTVSLPVLLAAIRRGEKYVRLDDGTQGMVPREWLERFGRLASLGERDGDVLRFQMSQTMLLDALLAAQDESLVSADERFEQVRNRLRQSSGAKPLAPPEGFQGTLRRYQQEGLGWLNFLQDIRCGGCLADDMGLGKTIQVLSLLEQRRRRPLGAGEERRPSLVVVPRSLVFNWVEEAKR